MNEEENSGDDETLEEGRVALHLLERQLKTTNSNSIQDDASEGSSRHNGSRQSLMAERRLLDQQPRDARLLLRKGSPLGLTLEELDDRGLLEGGGVVPSYYTSLRQKNRRQLELQDRSSRMRQRGNEDSLKFKVSSNILRMIRVLVQKGLNLEEYFRVSGYLSPGGGGDGASGGSESGMMDKDIFLTILRKLDLPFTLKDLILFSNRYAISSLQIDYELFLNDIQRGLDGDDSLAGSTSATGGPPPVVTPTTAPDGSGVTGRGGTRTSAAGSGNQTSLHTPRFHLVHDLKTMLLESKEILNKSYDEIYRMFSRWDNYGTGMVTITQFFRVLSQLHINFHDQDQDFLVDLLDNDGQGKVDFEGLLAYCFVSDVELNRIPSHVTATALHSSQGGGGGGGIDQHSDECLSASGGSIGNGTSSSSRYTSTGNGSNVRRPHTASAFRGPTYTTADSLGMGMDREVDGGNDSSVVGMLGGGGGGGYGSSADYYQMSSNSLSSPVNRRPLTASARVLNGEYKAKPKSNQEDRQVISNSTGGLRNVQSRPQSARLVNAMTIHDDSNFILEINSDNEAEDAFPLHTHHTETMPDIRGSHHYPQQGHRQGQGQGQGSQSLLISPVSHEKSHKTSSSLTATTLGQSSLEISATSLLSPYPTEYSRQHGSAPGSAAASSSSGGLPSVQPSTSSQTPYQLLSAPTQRPQSAGGAGAGARTGGAGAATTATTTTAGGGGGGGGVHLTTAKSNLRSAISVYLRKSGLSIQEIFHLFDNKNVRFFGSSELMETSRHYFNLHLSPVVASSLISAMAIGNSDRVSYSDLLVFVTDPTYPELEDKLMIQIANQLEQQGREYQYLLYSILSQEIQTVTSVTGIGVGTTQQQTQHQHQSHFPQQQQQQQLSSFSSSSQSTSSGIVSADSFRYSLNKLGFELSSDEIDRILTKYDTHGTNKCSVSRFMTMIQNNSHWKFALETISFHEEAMEECQIVRQRMSETGQRRHAIPMTYSYSSELVDMCEYLGIRILSEPELLWIVEEAVNAPLPEGWSLHSNQEGKTYFYNHKHNLTRWDHPLDPYFRKLRDENRKRNETITQSDKMGSGSLNGPPEQQQSTSLHNSLLESYRDQSVDNPGTDEEDVRDDMSDYYRVRSRKSSKRGAGGSGGGMNKASLVSTSSSALPPYTPAAASAAPPVRLLPSSSSPDVLGRGYHHTTRPLSAPEDHPRHGHSHGHSQQSSHGNNSQSTLPLQNRSQQQRYQQQQHQPSNILLPGGTYVDTGAGSGAGRGVPRSSTSNHRSSAQFNPTVSSKRGGAGGGAGSSSGGVTVTYNINGKKEKVRPSSTSRLRGQPQSAPVAMVMSKGNKSRQLQQQDPNRSLNRMFDGGLIDDLDAVMKYPQPHQQQHGQGGRGQGGSGSFGDHYPSETSVPMHGNNRSLDWPSNDPRRPSLLQQQQQQQQQQQYRPEKRSKDLETTIWL